MKMRMRKAMGSRQRGAETLPGAGMGCPRAGPLPGQGEERFREGGSEAVPGWSASFPPCPLFCQLWGTLPDALLSLCQPALRVTQETPESVRALEETENPRLPLSPASCGIVWQAGPLSHSSDGDTDSVSTMVVHDVEEIAGTQPPYGGGTMVVQRVSGSPYPFLHLWQALCNPTLTFCLFYRLLKRNEACCLLTAMATQTCLMWSSPATHLLRTAKVKALPQRMEAVM